MWIYIISIFIVFHPLFLDIQHHLSFSERWRFFFYYLLARFIYFKKTLRILLKILWFLFHILLMILILNLSILKLYIIISLFVYSLLLIYIIIMWNRFWLSSFWYKFLWLSLILISFIKIVVLRIWIFINKWILVINLRILSAFLIISHWI